MCICITMSTKYLVIDFDTCINEENRRPLITGTFSLRILTKG